jgi:hypothetical protein
MCGDYTDDQKECRIVHLAFAEDDPDAHCPHTLPEGGGVCADATN